MADVTQKVAQIRQAIYGKDVRESIASGIEAMNTECEDTTGRQTKLETDMATAKTDAINAAVSANTAAQSANTAAQSANTAKDEINSIISDVDHSLSKETLAILGLIPVDGGTFFDTPSTSEFVFSGGTY